MWIPKEPDRSSPGSKEIIMASMGIAMILRVFDKLQQRVIWAIVHRVLKSPLPRKKGRYGWDVGVGKGDGESTSSTSPDYENSKAAHKVFDELHQS